MFALKKKKLYEDEIAKLHGARITLENQIMALEGAAVNVETFRAMESGAQAMRAVRGNMYVFPSTHHRALAPNHERLLTLPRPFLSFLWFVVKQRRRAGGRDDGRYPGGERYHGPD